MEIVFSVVVFFAFLWGFKSFIERHFSSTANSVKPKAPPVSNTEVKPPPTQTTETVMMRYIEAMKQSGVVTVVSQGMSSEIASKIGDWATNAIRDYGRILEERKTIISDLRTLPIPKADLKVACMVGVLISLKRKRHNDLHCLRSAYPFLSSFQELSPSDINALNVMHNPMTAGGTDLSSKKPEDLTATERRELLATLARSSETFPTIQRTMEKVAEEAATLLNEFDAFLKCPKTDLS